MLIFITMAGKSSRFLNEGYKIPKFKIEVRNKSLFEWSMLSLRNFINEKNLFIFITLKEHNAVHFIDDECRKINISRYQIIELEDATDGQATTVMMGAKHFNQKNEEIIIYNIDTHVDPDELSPADIKGDGWIPCFEAEGDSWSFVKTNFDNHVIEVKEKQRISNYATIGLYFFKNLQLFEQAYKTYYKNNNNLEKNEKYIAPMYNYLINKDLKVFMHVIEKSFLIPLGTPEEVNTFRVYKTTN